MTRSTLFPPIGGWDSLHPLIVHLPIGILYVAGIWVGLGVVPSSKPRPADLCGLLLVWVGTICAWVTVSTGRAAGALVERTDEIAAVLSRHAWLAGLTRNSFTALAVLYAAIVLVPRLVGKDLPAVPRFLVRGLFGALYLGALLLIAHTAHLGGVMVHDLGVQAMIPR